MADFSVIGYRTPGQQRVADATDDALLQKIKIKDTAQVFSIGANQAASEIQIGAASQTTRLLGDLIVNGNATVSTTSNLNGDVNLGNGGDTINIGSGTDAVNLLDDLTLGAGAVSLGTSAADYAAGMWLVAVNNNGPDADAYGLNVSGTNAGSYSIGVDPSLLANASATDLMTVLDQLDAAITGAAAGSLQASYVGGPDITQNNVQQGMSITRGTNVEAAPMLELSDSGGVVQPLLTLTHTSTGAVQGSLFVNSAVTGGGGTAAAIIRGTGGNADSLTVVRQPGGAIGGGNVLSIGGDSFVASSGVASMVRVGEIGVNNAIDFDHRDFNVSANTALTYAFTATTQPTTNTKGVSFSITAGTGDPGTGAGGDLTFTAGAAQNTGAAGVTTIKGGAGVFAVGGNVVIDGGVSTTTTNGIVVIGAGTSSATTIGQAGITGKPATVNHAEVSGSAGNGTVALNVTGSVTAGSYAIGCYDNPAWTQINPANSDLQAVLDAIDAAIAAGGTVPSLDAVMTTGTIDNAVNVASGNEPLFSDAGNALAGAVFTVEKSSSGASPGFYVNGTGGTGGNVVQVDDTSGNTVLNVAASGDLIVGNDAAGGSSLSIALGGDMIGSVTDSNLRSEVTNTAAPNLLFLMDNSGTMLGSTSAGAGEGGGDITFQADSASATGDAGDVYIGSTNSVAGGSEGGLVLNAGTTFPAAAAGTVTVAASVDVSVTATADLDMNAADATLDVTGGFSFDAAAASNMTVSGATADLTLGARGATITLNESGDTALVGYTATSIIGALNEVKAGAGAITVSLPIENGVTIAAGDTIAASTVAGRVTLMNANANANGAYVGVATVGGTGDAGGTVEATFVAAGPVTGLSGLTAGAPAYAPDGTGAPTATAPSNSGDLVFRVGFAYSASAMIIHAGEGTVL